MFEQPKENPPPFVPKNLLNAKAFPHESPSLKLMQTHISWVVLTGKYAYKIKKPVQLPFVDYSTLALRKHFCEYELELNRELAPDIYIDVVPITGPASSPSINGDGDVLEYSVRMNEFDQSDILAARLDHGLVTLSEVDRLAELIARFHHQIPQAPNDTPFGTPDQIRQEADENFSAFQINTKEPLTIGSDWHPALSTHQRNQLEQLRNWTNSEFKRCEKGLSARRATGMIRCCHGDMHAGNIVLFNGRIEIFDRIEFNQSFQWIDCMNELAFPVMDLIHHGRPDLAHRLLNDYLEFTGDYPGLAVFRFYLVYRSMVRAKVDWIKQRQTRNAAQEREAGDFQTPFIELAVNLTREPERFLYITHGPSGSGKSTAAKKCVELTGAVCIRSDVERDRLQHQDSTVLPTEKYSSPMRSKVYEAMLETASDVLESGFSVIADATFLRQNDRNKFHELAVRRGVNFGIIDCEAAVAELERRIENRQRDASEATIAVLHDQIQNQDPLTQEERERSYRCPPSDFSLK